MKEQRSIGQWTNWLRGAEMVLQHTVQIRDRVTEIVARFGENVRSFPTEGYRHMHRNNLRWLLVSLAVGGCSNAGLGLAHHPLDCAIGIAWGDCLPGTPGYNRGGGQMTRADETKEQEADIKTQSQAVAKQCESDMQSADLDLIRSKVELFRTVNEAPPPFAIASNDTFPTQSERPVIARWATIRDECLKRRNAISYIPPSANALQTAFLQQMRSFSDETAGRVSELIIDLYQAKLTYGEFAQKRYEIGRSQAAAERQFREASLIADQQRQMEAQQLAQQQFQNSLAALSTYMQSVSARQPQTVYLQGNIGIRTNCSSQQIGSFVNTHCQ